MSIRALRWSLLALVTASVLCTAGRAWGIGFYLGQTKEELKLKYDVQVVEYGSATAPTGRIAVVLTLADEGRLAPLETVELAIPAQEKNPDGSYYMDLVVSIDMSKTADGKRAGRVVILKSLAERAEIRLNTHTLDGKLDGMTRLHHVIPIAKYLKPLTPTTAPVATTQPTPAPAAPAPPATERQ